MVVASESPSTHSGGIAVFYCAAEHFSVEALQLHGTNVASFQLASGIQKWYIVGCYLAPKNASKIEVVVAAISQRLRGSALPMSRYSNTDLAAPEGRAWGD